MQLTDLERHPRANIPITFCSTLVRRMKEEGGVRVRKTWRGGEIRERPNSRTGQKQNPRQLVFSGRKHPTTAMTNSASHLRLNLVFGGWECVGKRVHPFHLFLLGTRPSLCGPSRTSSHTLFPPAHSLSSRRRALSDSAVDECGEPVGEEREREREGGGSSKVSA